MPSSHSEWLFTEKNRSWFWPGLWTQRPNWDASLIGGPC